MKDLAHAVAKVIRGVKISINRNARPEERSNPVDFSLFRELAPDRQPRVDLLKAVRARKQGLENMKFAAANFRDSQFMRLEGLRRFRECDVPDGHLRWLQPGDATQSEHAG